LVNIGQNIGHNLKYNRSSPAKWYIRVLGWPKK